MSTRDDQSTDDIILLSQFTAAEECEGREGEISRRWEMKKDERKNGRLTAGYQTTSDQVHAHITQDLHLYSARVPNSTALPPPTSLYPRVLCMGKKLK